MENTWLFLFCEQSMQLPPYELAVGEQLTKIKIFVKWGENWTHNGTALIQTQTL